MNDLGDFNFINYEIDEEYENDIKRNKAVFDKKFKERYDVLESNIWTVKHIKKAALKKGSQDNALLWNVYGFINIVAFDLISVGYNLIFEEKRWQKIYFARQVALIIVEALKDIPEVLGKNYKQLFYGIDIAEGYLDELNKYKKELENYKTLHLKKLYEIRIIVGAHRDQDIDKQLEIISKIDPYTIIKVMTDFENIIRKILEHLQKLLVYTVKPEE
jgi:hypothetical protein